MTKSWCEEVLAADLRKLGIIYVREHEFDPTRKWRFDFAILPIKVGIEVEGGTFAKSRHTSGQGYADDCEKYNAAALQGWRVLRFTSAQVMGVLDKKQPCVKYRARDVILELVKREEHRADSQEARPQEEAPHPRPKRGRTKGRRPPLRQRQAQADRRREGLPEEGEGPTPRDLQGQGQGEQRQAGRKDFGTGGCRLPPHEL